MKILYISIRRERIDITSCLGAWLDLGQQDINNNHCKKLQNQFRMQLKILP